MKLGIMGGIRENDFIYAKEHDLKFIELCINVGTETDDYPTVRADEANALQKKHGVYVGSVGRWGTSRLNPDGSFSENEYKNDKKLIEFAKKVGSPVYVFGCNRPEDLDDASAEAAAREYVAAIVEECGDGIAPALYNCDWNSFTWQTKLWDRWLEEFPTLGVKFDPSHSYYRGEDQYAILREYVSRLKHFHAKGTNMIAGKRYDDPPAGLDDQNWRKIFGILYAGKYNGGITMEPHSGRWSDELGEWGKEFSINYIKQFIFDN